ncbi:MAG: MarR family winged helix-turn-helix transcriptional regulator [Ghiorsea sp.]
MSKMRLHELIDQLGFLLRAEQRKKGIDSGLQPIHYQLLGYLNQCNRYSNTPAAVTRYLELTKGTVSQSLLLLENKGLINKQADTKDRRVVHLCLTDKGKKALLSGTQSAAWQETCDNHNADLLAHLSENLESLLRGLQRANGSRTFGLCKTCRHLRVDKDEFRCGLTGEVLLAEETKKICHEHEFPKAA